MQNENENVGFESQSGTEPEMPGVGEGSPTVTQYGIFKFDSLTIQERNQIMKDYIAALQKGWDVKDAETITREAHDARMNAVVQPDPPDPETTTTEQPEKNIEPDRNMPTAIKILLAILAVGAIAFFVGQRVAPAAPAAPDPLTAAIETRAAAAKAYAKSHPARIALDKLDDANKAAYEVAYKREACLVAGNCK